MPTDTVSGRGLGKTYAGGVTAVDDVDIDIAGGSVTAVVGANGAGKTTLLRLLAGALEPSSGEVTLLGLRQPSAHAGPLRALQGKLSYIDQDPALDAEMTGRETLRLLAALYGVRAPSAAAAIDDLASRFGVVELLDRQVGAYSGGQKRRLHLACALLHSPEVIFADEPTAGLDGEGARLLWAELDRRAQAGATVVVVGHDLDEIEREAARVIMLDRGRVVASASPAALIAEHGRTWLRVTLRPVADAAHAAAVVAAAESLSGFSRASCEGRRLWVQVDEFSPNRVGDLLAALAAPIADVAVHRQDLASVYRTLTGHDAGEPRRAHRRGRA